MCYGDVLSGESTLAQATRFYDEDADHVPVATGRGRRPTSGCRADYKASRFLPPSERVRGDPDGSPLALR